MLLSTSEPSRCTNYNLIPWHLPNELHFSSHSTLCFLFVDCNQFFFIFKVLASSERYAATIGGPFLSRRTTVMVISCCFTSCWHLVRCIQVENSSKIIIFFLFHTQFFHRSIEKGEVKLNRKFRSSVLNYNSITQFRKEYLLYVCIPFKREYCCYSW